MIARPSLLVLAGAATLVLSPTAQARAPYGGEASYKWKRYECVETSQGYRSVGSIRTHVSSVEHEGVRYYQKVTIQIDRAAGYSDTNPTWRKVSGASKTYSWSRFGSRDVPTYSTSGVRTGMQNDAATLTAKATVRLKRVRKGYDTTVWSYTARSPTFECAGLVSASP